MQNLEGQIEKLVMPLLPRHNIAEGYHYALFPAGKLFRPQLVMALAKDFNTQNELNHLLLAASVETHHAYTLVHDDLPCMDNDDFRRGRPSTHKIFGEWRALLIGDGLLNVSLQLLSKIQHSNSSNLLKYYLHNCGPKGLIHGQTLDLSLEMNQSFEKLTLTHELKTARLIQTALTGSYLLTDLANFKKAKDIHRLGQKLGITFQLIDDLTELTEIELSEHEKNVNPWPKYKGQCVDYTFKLLNETEVLLNQLELKNVETIVRQYYAKMFSSLNNGRTNVEKHSGYDTEKLMQVLKTLSHF